MIESTQAYADTPLLLLNLYYLVVLLGAIYIYWKYRANSKWTILVILIFWQGLFHHFDFISPSPINFNGYKVFVFIYILYFFFPNIYNYRLKSDVYINLFFVLFSLVFWISYEIHQPPLITTLSQYGFIYTTTFLLYHGLKEVLVHKHIKIYLLNILYSVLIFQIIFAFAKLLILGTGEGIVGSIQRSGGGTAVLFPILGLFLLWLRKKGYFQRKDIWLILLLLSVALISSKRAPVILLPLYFFWLTIGFKGFLRPAKILKYMPIFLLALYIGVKTVPSLNKENSYWGSFDLNYVMDYSLTYTFGVQDISKIDEEANRGRGASLFMLFNPGEINLTNTSGILFGNGFEDVVLQKKGRFVGGEGYGIEHVGVMSAALMELYSYGYAGLLFMFFFSISIIAVTKHKKFKWVVISLYLYDFLLYGNILLFNGPLSFLVLFICLYSNTVPLGGKKLVLKR
ncbi:MAG: hypothetical protein ACOCWG_00420 [bacterium]